MIKNDEKKRLNRAEIIFYADVMPESVSSLFFMKTEKM